MRDEDFDNMEEEQTHNTIIGLGALLFLIGVGWALWILFGIGPTILLMVGLFLFGFGKSESKKLKAKKSAQLISGYMDRLGKRRAIVDEQVSELLALEDEENDE